MRGLFVAALLLGCEGKKPAPAPRPMPVVAVAVDAAPIDAAPIDASVPVVVDAPEEGEVSILDTEALGGLKIGDDEAAVIGKLGKPSSKSVPQLEGATADYASNWKWPTASVNMVAETATAPARARLISISKSSKLETSRGIRIGSTRADVEKVYKRSEDDDGSQPESYLVGSMYGGLLFTFAAGKVTAIAIGPFAF